MDKFKEAALKKFQKKPERQKPKTQSYADAISALKKEFPNLRLDPYQRRFLCPEFTIKTGGGRTKVTESEHVESMKLLKAFQARLIGCGLEPFKNLFDLYQFLEGCAVEFCCMVDYKEKKRMKEEGVYMHRWYDHIDIDLYRACDPLPWSFAYYIRCLKSMELGRKDQEKKQVASND